MLESVLQINNIGISFPYMDKKVLDGITYNVEQDDFVVVLGSNGSGKSTLIKLIDQRLFPTEGSINYCALSGSGKCLDIMTLTQNIQASIFHNMTVLENFLLWSYRYNLFKLFVNKKVIAKQFVNHLKDINSPLIDKIHTNISCLSGGEMQALLLVVCFYMKPKLLLLDEHTSALDPKMSEQIIKTTAKFVRVNRVPCIMTTHNIEHALTYGNRLLVLKDGKIILQANDLEKKNLTKTEIISLY